MRPTNRSVLHDIILIDWVIGRDISRARSRLRNLFGTSTNLQFLSCQKTRAFGYRHFCTRFYHRYVYLNNIYIYGFYPHAPRNDRIMRASTIVIVLMTPKYTRSILLPPIYLFPVPFSSTVVICISCTLKSSNAWLKHNADDANGVRIFNTALAIGMKQMLHLCKYATHNKQP